MNSVAKRRNARRRLAALAFLSNISLDGTHRDTPLGTLNLNVHRLKSDKNNCPKITAIKPPSKEPADIHPTHLPRNTTVTRRLTISEGVGIKKCEKTRWTSCDEKIGGSDYNENKPLKSRDRVHKFITDTKTKLSNLSQRRRQLQYQKSITESHGLPTGISTESLAHTLHSRRSSITHFESNRNEFDAKKSRLLNDLVQSDRVVLTSPSSKLPVAVFSFLPFQRHSSSVARYDIKPEGIRRRHNSSLRQLSTINDESESLDLFTVLGIEKPQDGQDISFAHLLSASNLAKRCRSYATDVQHHQVITAHHLHPSGCMSFDQMTASRPSQRMAFSAATPTSVDKANLNLERQDITCRHPCHLNTNFYNPNLLDDPELIAGKHSVHLVLPSYVTSVISYVKPSDLKKDLNDKFKERFPHIHLTLSKLRSLKKEMLKIGRFECNIDISIVAQAFVYFEKLILKMLVNKQNRKLCAGACLMLSAKLNDVKGLDLQNLLEKIETVFRVSRKELIFLEFRVLVALEFSLHLSQWEVLPHYQRLIHAS